MKRWAVALLVLLALSHVVVEPSRSVCTPSANALIGQTYPFTLSSIVEHHPCGSIVALCVNEQTVEVNGTNVNVWSNTTKICTPERLSS